MSINKKILVAAVAGLTLGASSCKKYLDVNNNPNVAATATAAAVLPAAQLHIGTAMGANLQVVGAIWAQHWTQAPDGKEYVQFDQINPKAEAFNTAWNNLYAGAENFNQLKKIAARENKSQYAAIAWLMQAYTFQTLADGWGDVPYTEALRGQDMTGIIVNPKYDSQRVVYRGVLACIDSANVALATVKGARPGADDLVYGGDMNKWKKFSNTLRLRTILRMASVDPILAQEAMDSLLATNPQFIGMGDDARIAYNGAAGNNHPLFAELNSIALAGNKQLAASKTCVDSMLANNDKRIAATYTNITGMGFVGVQQSSYDVALPNGTYSLPGSAVLSASAAVNLITSAESYFLQAEAAARGLMTADDATLFFNGVRASFVSYDAAIQANAGMTSTAAYSLYVNGDVSTATPPAHWAMYPVFGTTADKVNYIITQKWFAMSGTQGFEAWTERRRTGYPTFLVTPRNSFIGNAYPARMLYPASEATANSKFPGQQPITAPVWWASL